MIKAGPIIFRMRNSLPYVSGCLLLFALCGCQREINTESETVHVFAAVSLKEAIEEIGTLFERETDFEISLNSAGSNVLAQQIEASSRADLFISADSGWIDYLESGGKLGDNTRIDLLTNTLVMVCAQGASWDEAKVETLCGLDFTFLCIGHPDAVPAGRYARDWLSGLNCGDSTVWEAFQERLSPAPDVRAALSQVASSKDRIGIVYFTDYLLYQDRLKLLLEGPSEKARYPAAMTEQGMEKLAAGRFFTFLQSNEARLIFEKFGFRVDLPEED